MDKKTIKEVKNLIIETAEQENIKLQEFIIFGSRTKENYREKSDVDILLVSEKFENVNYLKRAIPFQNNWKYNHLPTPEFICLTPKEFKEKKDQKPHIVNTAINEGIKLA